MGNYPVKMATLQGISQLKFDAPLNSPMSRQIVIYIEERALK